MISGLSPTFLCPNELKFVSHLLPSMLWMVTVLRFACAIVSHLSALPSLFTQLSPSTLDSLSA